ncbi:uncharacterized protein V6R79_016683 [Siganus canaliculatus]
MRPISSLSYELWETKERAVLLPGQNKSMKPLLLLPLFGQLMFAASRPLPALTCNITRQPDGFFQCALSKPPSSHECVVAWENENKTSIVYKSAAEILKDDKLVRSVTDMGIVMNACQPMHYTVTCLTGITFEEAFCNVNCSLISVVDPTPPTELIMGEPMFFFINLDIHLALMYCFEPF